MIGLLMAHSTEILGGLLVVEQVLAQTKIVKANSSLQLIFSIFGAFRKKSV